MIEIPQNLASTSGGEGGIRTLGTLTRTQHFQCCTFGRSVTSPSIFNMRKKRGVFKFKTWECNTLLIRKQSLKKSIKHNRKPHLIATSKSTHLFSIEKKPASTNFIYHFNVKSSVWRGGGLLKLARQRQTRTDNRGNRHQF